MLRPSHWNLLALASLGLACVGGSVAWAKVPAKSPSDPVKGRMLYEDHCWQCHGPQGLGDGPLAAGLGGPLRTLRGMDEALWPGAVDTIQQGHGDMPAYAEVMDRYDSRRILVWFQALDQGKTSKDLQPTRGVKATAPPELPPTGATPAGATPDTGSPDPDPGPGPAAGGDAE